MRRTKANRALTFVMAAALLIGSIHGVGAKEQSKAYEAPELTLVQGASDYDLTEGITYDSEKYTLSVTDTGNFDINVAGDYEISYALTGKAEEADQTPEGDDQTSDTDTADQDKPDQPADEEKTADQDETDSAKDPIDSGNAGQTQGTSTGAGEAEDQGGGNTDKVDDQTSGTDTADQDKPDQPADKDEADSAKDPTDSGNAGQLQGTSTGVGEAQESENQDDGNTDTVKEESADTDTVNITEEQTPKAANATQEVINFSRTVKVVAAEEPVETYAANYRVASYANVQGNYTVNLGTPVWTDETHKKFQYTNAKIDTGSDDISLMTITLSNGKLPDDILNNATVRDDYGRSATWIFMDKKSSQEIEKKIQTMTFDYVSDMNVYVSVNANDNEGFESGLDQMKLTQWSVSGHYYLHVNEKVSWTSAYDRAKTYKLAGQRGYLATITSNDELSYILTLQKGQTWTAGTRLIMKDGSSLNDTPFGRITNGIVKYGQDYYWAAGPETGEKIESLWGSGEPNRASVTYGALNGTISDVQGQESCVMVRNTDIKTLNDIIEGNVPGDTDITSGGFFVEFGGYADGADPGQPDNTKKGETNVLVAPMDAEAVINGVKYAPLADALDTAQAGDTVEIVKDTVTAVTGGTMKKSVQLKSKDGTWFSAPGDAVDVTLDIAADGTVTLKDGTLNVSDNGTLNVYSPVDHNTYKVTTPAGASSVVVPNGTGDDTPYLKNHNTTGALTLKIGDVTYTYTNQSFDAITLVYIPDAMYRNELVTKAEVPADKTAEIRLDDTDSVKTKGTGNASDKVTVERRNTDKKADVKIPSGASADVFGHEVGAAPANGVTVSQGSTTNSGYPSRDYVTIPVGESIVIDGVTYNATDSVQRYYLGTFNVAVTTGNNAEISGGAKPADPGYLQQYKVKISPKAYFDLDKDNFTVTMKKSDTGAAETLPFAQVCKEETDGSITVTIPQVTGDITINAAAKRQLTTLNVEGLTAGGAKGVFKAVDASGNTYELATDGSIQVNRNEELTLTFTPDDFDDRYYSDLTGEKGESFSILTALTDTTDHNADLFATATFNWTEKSYEITYTPAKADVTLKAVFTPSHIVHLHVTGGTAEVTDHTLVTKETGASQFQHVIVADDKTVEVTLKDTTANGLVPTAYWSDVSESPENAGTDVSAALQNTGAKTYTYTTQKVKQPQALNVTFEQGQTVEVTVNNGKLLNDDGAWNENSGTYTRIVKNNAPLVLKIKPDDGYGLKGITVNGYPIDIEKALEDRALEYDSATGIYTHTTHGIYQAWKVTVDLEKQHQFIFEDQNGAQIASGERITVIDGGTIAEAVFAKMQRVTDGLKADNESFFVWVDKANTGKVYNGTTVISSQTADKVTLIPVYRTNVVNGADGSSIAADDFVIHVNDVGNLTASDAKNRANVKAYGANGDDITATVTVDQDKLDELTAKGKGIYAAALTFQAGAGAATSITVEVTDDKPAVIGQTAHTLTFTGRPKTEYSVRELDTSGNPVGHTLKFKTDENGKGIASGLKKATEYKISHSNFGSTVGKTSLVDAADIAKQFEEKGAGDTNSNNATDNTEKAENSNVEVTVDDNGNYKVTVKKDIDQTVQIPDTWGDIRIDLGGHTITGDKADDDNAAKPGLEFVKDANSNEHPGTNLEIVNGTIKGGDGSAKHPDGAAGIGASGDTADAGIIIGNNANVTGGNGANGTEGKDGGNGGAGIDGNGKITPTVSGTVTGGNGGKGGNSATDIPGNGGNGGSGISAGDKTITINPGGTVKGGDAGNGGNATGDNTNPGGNGGNGGTGTETTQPGKTDNNGGTTSGGNGGDGGKSDNGNGGNGGNGGSGSTGENNNNGGTSSGGSGGNGGDSDKGNGGSGGNGESSGETGGTGGDNTGGNGGNGGGSNNGNGGTGGNGGDSNNGTGGNGGNGGDSNNGTGGSGGNGGDSNSGTGGNGGNGGGSDSGTGGNGGNGGDSNSGNGGTGGDGGNGKDPGNGGNGGGSNSGNNGSSGSDGSKPDNNGGNNVGNNNGGNSNGNGGSNGGDNGNNNGGNGSNNGSTSGGNSNGNANGTNTGVTDGKTNATDIAATDGNNASGGNKNNKHNRNNRNNNESDQADGEDVTEGTETGADSTDADTGSDDTTDVADSTETGADADGSGNADDSIPADSSDADGHISFADCGSHWYPVILILVIAGYTVLRIRKIREELDGE